MRGEENDIVHGLGLGADDYITKPFSPRQLVARAQAVLRRAGRTTAPAIRQVGGWRCDPSRRELSIGGREAVSLTPLESRLLDYLMLNAGHVLTAEAIITHVWGAEGGDRDMLRQLVHRLRLEIARAAGPGAGESDCDDSRRSYRNCTRPGLLVPPFLLLRIKLLQKRPNSPTDWVLFIPARLFC